jgi:hypothetical protein
LEPDPEDLEGTDDFRFTSAAVLSVRAVVAVSTAFVAIPVEAAASWSDPEEGNVRAVVAVSTAFVVRAVVAVSTAFVAIPVEAAAWSDPEDAAALFPEDAISRGPGFRKQFGRLRLNALGAR